jgi:hypothetical protein
VPLLFCLQERAFLHFYHGLFVNFSLLSHHEGLNGCGLANILGSERLRIEQTAPRFGGLTRMLDLDGDGQIVDDILQIAEMLSRFFGR